LSGVNFQFRNVRVPPLKATKLGRAALFLIAWIVVMIMDINKLDKRLIWIAPIAVMAIGILPMPYSYYTLSRLVVCGCALFLMHRLYLNQDKWFCFVFGFIAVLYNPIFQMQLNARELWMIANAFTAIVLLLKRNSAGLDD